MGHDSKEQERAGEGEMREKVIAILCEMTGWKDIYVKKHAEKLLALVAGRESQWIACSEREPDREGRYIVTYAFGDGDRRRTFIGDYDPQYGWSNRVDDSRIIAWMESPEPFKPKPPADAGNVESE